MQIQSCNPLKNSEGAMPEYVTEPCINIKGGCEMYRIRCENCGHFFNISSKRYADNKAMCRICKNADYEYLKII